MPIFSIIMPAYNREATIEGVIDAILNQTFTNFELIVVDDGSTDSTRTKIQHIEDKRIRLLTQSNERQTQARRIACRQAKGKFYAFCDSDDIWHPEYLSTVFNIFSEYAADYVFTNYQVQGETSTRINIESEKTTYWLQENTTRISERLFVFEDLYTALLKYQPIFTSCQAITASHYREIGGISDKINNIKYGPRLTSEDSHIIRKSALAKKSYFINLNLVTLGRQGDNTSHSYVSNLKGGLAILEDILSTSSLNKKQIIATKKSILEHQAEVALQLYYAEEYTQFVSYYLSINPLKLATKSHIHFVLAMIKRYLFGITK